jgi:outer membrane lipoprotein SlyB
MVAHEALLRMSCKAQKKLVLSLGNLLEATDYQVIHAIAGRIRCRLPALQTDQRFADQLQHSLGSLQFVTEVRVNSAAQSIIISYKDRVISSADFEAGFAKLIQQLKSAPAVPEPMPLSTTTEQPLQPSSPQPQIAEPTPTESVTDSAPQVAVEPSVFLADSGQAVMEAAELPSPWDDVAASAQPEPPKTTADLARRLGVTGQALNRRRSQSNFAVWTQTHDPQGVAWIYDPDSKLFYAKDKSAHSAITQPDPSAAQIAKTAKQVEEATGEVVTGSTGEAVGAMIGEVVGGALLGPPGALIGEEMGAVVGEIAGAEFGKEIVETIEHKQKSAPTLAIEVQPVESIKPEQEVQPGNSNNSARKPTKGQQKRQLPRRSPRK